MSRLTTPVHRRGLTLTEVLVAVAALAVIAGPVLTLATQNLHALRADRARAFAERAALATIERFGTGVGDVRRWLAPDPADPFTLSSRDLFERVPTVFAEMGLSAAPTFKRTHALTIGLSLRQDAVPGLDLLVCEVSWSRDGGTKGPRERVSHARALLHPQVN